MKRIQAIEFEDYAWFPAQWRNFMTDFFHYQMKTFNLYRPAVDLLAQALRQTGKRQIVDMCSGGSGPLALIQKQLKQQHGLDVPVRLTDKFPNLPAFEKIVGEAEGEIRFSNESVDATNVSESLDGFRTIFSAFHHFPPSLATRILQDCVDKRAPIGIFELSNRSFSAFFQVLLAGPLSIFFLTPFFKPRSWQRFFWTYVIPVIPFFVAFDGAGSNLRAYAPDELLELVGQVSGQDQFKWQAGVKSTHLPGVRVTYLIGMPRATPG
jgi:hypothetical protein